MKFTATENSEILNMGDSELWNELKKSNPDALHVLFYRYYNDLYFYGTKLVNDNNLIIDTIQDLFSNLWENKKRLSDVQHIKAYIFQIFRNNLVKTAQKNIGFFSFKDISKMPEKEFILSQEDVIIENLAFGLKIKKVDKKSIRERVMKAAGILEIEELLDRKPKAMSGGQNQRVAIGRAIVRDPKVFLFDEPLSNLDANLRVQMRIEIAKLHKRLNATVVYVTHDQVEAMTLGDRIAILDKGEIQQIDTPSNLYANPANLFVAGFIGTPPMNFIHGKAIKTSNGILFTDNSQIFKVNLPSNHPLRNWVEKEVVLGIRSEDIYHQINESERNFTVLNCQIEFIEKLGHEIYAYVVIGDQQIISRLKPDAEIMKGSMIDLHFDIRKMYFFDKSTGATLQD